MSRFAFAVGLDNAPWSGMICIVSLKDAHGHPRPGEDEVAAALRLLERVLTLYPRAFEVAPADGLYADPRVFNYLHSRGKDVLAVLKDNHPALLEDARGLFENTPPA